MGYNTEERLKKLEEGYAINNNLLQDASLAQITRIWLNELPHLQVIQFE